MENVQGLRLVPPTPDPDQDLGPYPRATATKGRRAHRSNHRSNVFDVCPPGEDGPSLQIWPLLTRRVELRLACADSFGPCIPPHCLSRLSSLFAWLWQTRVCARAYTSLVQVDEFRPREQITMSFGELRPIAPAHAPAHPPTYPPTLGGVTAKRSRKLEIIVVQAKTR